MCFVREMYVLVVWHIKYTYLPTGTGNLRWRAIHSLMKRWQEALPYLFL